MNLPRNTYVRYMEDIPASELDLRYVDAILQSTWEDALNLSEDECFEESEGLELER